MRQLLHGVITSIVAMALAGAASVAPAGPAASHLGQSPNDHVVLEIIHVGPTGCGSGSFDFARVLPDASYDYGPTSNGWRVPAGKVLVVTDLDWQYNHPGGAAGAGKREILNVSIVNMTTSMDIRVMESTIVLDASGEGGTSEAATAGFVVSSAARICVETSPDPAFGGGGINHLLLRGYLMSDR